MSNVVSSLSIAGEDKFLTLFDPSGQREPKAIHNSQPNFEAVLEAAQNDDIRAFELADVSQTVAAKFERLSERVTVANGRLYFDGDEVDNSLAKQVIRFITEDTDVKPLVSFFENVQQNPNEHSREQLYDWLDKQDFTITSDGLIVGYKGVKSDLTSINSGPGIVNGEAKNGQLDNSIGNVIEMPRSQVAHDPAQGCATGLHVGTYDYASNFAQGAVLEVHVHPRDVVSVPTHSSWAKMRTCRYKVISQVSAPFASALRDDYDDAEADDWYDEHDEG